MARLEKRFLAEGVGTFVLVFAGCGTAVLDTNGAGVLGVSIAFGVALLTMVFAIGHISGCHVNPAVTVGLVVAGRHDKKDLPGYVIAQVLGGILAAGLVYAIANGNQGGGYDLAKEGLAANGYGDHSPGGYGMAAALLSEVVLTALFLFVILGATDGASHAFGLTPLGTPMRPRETPSSERDTSKSTAPIGFAGLAIGLSLTLLHLIGIPITNLSANPARSIGPALFVRGWALEQLWLFVVGPILGAVFGALVYTSLRPTPEATPTAHFDDR